jgi:hypothetical protein
VQPTTPTTPPAPTAAQLAAFFAAALYHLQGDCGADALAPYLPADPAAAQAYWAALASRLGLPTHS